MLWKHIHLKTNISSSNCKAVKQKLVMASAYGWDKVSDPWRAVYAILQHFDGYYVAAS